MHAIIEQWESYVWNRNARDYARFLTNIVQSLCVTCILVLDIAWLFLTRENVCIRNESSERELFDSADKYYGRRCRPMHLYFQTQSCDETDEHFQCQVVYGNHNRLPVAQLKFLFFRFNLILVLVYLYSTLVFCYFSTRQGWRETTEMISFECCTGFVRDTQVGRCIKGYWALTSFRFKIVYYDYYLEYTVRIQTIVSEQFNKLLL